MGGRLRAASTCAKLTMMRAFATLVVLLSGCYDTQAYDDLLALQGERASSTESTTAGTTGSASTWPGSVSITEPTGDASGGESATAGDTEPGDAEPDTGGDGEGEPEPLVYLEVAPTSMAIAGHIELFVEHSADVERLALFANDDPAPIEEWLAGEAPPTPLITRGQDELRTYTVRAYVGDDDDIFATSNEAHVELELPAPGSLLWEESVDVGVAGHGQAVAFGTMKEERSLVSAFRDSTSARVGRHDDQGKAWMVAPPSDSLMSTTTGVAITAAGAVLAVGVDLVDNEERLWLSRIEPFTGAVEPLFQGKLGEAATGCAYDPVSDRIYVSGFGPRPGSLASDARIWAFTSAGELLWTRSWERPVSKPAFAGKPTDIGHAVTVTASGEPVLVGESRLNKEDDDPWERWAFANRYDHDGSLSAGRSWTSVDAADGAGAYAVAPDLDDRILVAGWSSPTPGTPPLATVFSFTAELDEAEIHTHGPSGEWRAKGVARLPTGEFVYAADVDDKEQDRHNVELRAMGGLFGPPVWNHIFEAEVEARIGGLTVTPEGFILVIGTKTDADGKVMFLAGFHP